MTTLPFVEGNASEYNLEEDYASEDYDSEDYSNWTEVAPDSNLVESVYYDVRCAPELIDKYVPAPAHAAPTIEAENAIEESAVVEAAEADATLESEITVEEEEDTMSEWSEDEVWVAGEEGLTIQEFAELNAPFEEETWIAGEEGLTIQEFAESNTPFEEETWVAGEGVMIEDCAELYTPSEEGTWGAIEESAEEAVEAITTMITIPAATSSTLSLIPMWSSTVVKATGDSTVPAHDWEALLGCCPMIMLQECRTVLLTAVENFFIEVERFRIRLRRFINSVLGKWEATKVD